VRNRVTLSCDKVALSLFSSLFVPLSHTLSCDALLCVSPCDSVVRQSESEQEKAREKAREIEREGEREREREKVCVCVRKRARELCVGILDSAVAC